MAFESFFNTILGLGTLASHIFLIVFILFYIYIKVLKKELPGFAQDIWEFLEKNALALAFIGVLFGIFGSLIYSEIIKLPPCDLCWYQRAMLYPQLVILGVALFKKSRDSFDYVFILCLIGIMFAGYQYTLQMVSYSGPCPIGSGGANCFTKDVFELGYITLPLMSLTMFVYIILLTYIWKKGKQLETKQIIERIEESE